MGIHRQSQYGYHNGLRKRKDSEYYEYRFTINSEVFTGSTEQRLLKNATVELERVKNIAKNQMLGTILSPDSLPIMSKAIDIWIEDNPYPKKSLKHIRTFNNASKWFIKAFGNKRIDLITNTDINNMFKLYMTPYDSCKIPESKRNKEYKPVMKQRTASGYNNLLRYLSLLYSHFIDFKKWIPKKPFDIEFLPEDDKEINYLTKEELPLFLKAVDKTNNLHQSVCCRLMIYMGLRESEALNFKKAGFNLSKGTYTPTKTKGKEAKPLHLHDELVKWLKKLPDDSNEYLLANEDGLPHSEGFTRKCVERGGKAIGRTVTPHDLRKTCATLLAKNKTNALVIQRIMRHKSLSTTRKYVALNIEDEAEAINTAFS